MNILRTARTLAGAEYFVTVAILTLFLIASILGTSGRARILSLESSNFEDLDNAKLLFVMVVFLAFNLAVLALNFLSVRIVAVPDPIIRLARHIPLFSFLIFIQAPSFYSYFKEDSIFTDFDYTLNFLSDDLIQEVSDENFVYPTSFLWLRALPLPYQNEHFRLSLILISTFVFSLCIAHYSKKLGFIQILAFTALLTSPPMMWLSESQNIDFPIAACLYVCAINYKDKYSLANTSIIVIISMISLIKIYAVPILVYLLITSYVRAVKIQILLSLVFLLPVLFSDARKILDLLPLGADNNAVGVKVFFYFLGVPPSPLVLLSCISIVVIFSKVIFWTVKGPAPNVFLNREYLAIFNLVVFISCFFATSNYPYRLVYLLFVIPSLLSCINRDQLRLAAAFAFVAFFAYTRSLGLLMNLFLLPLFTFTVISLVTVLISRFTFQVRR